MKSIILWIKMKFHNVCWILIFCSHMLTLLLVLMAIGDDHNFHNNDIQCTAAKLEAMFSFSYSKCWNWFLMFKRKREKRRINLKGTITANLTTLLTQELSKRNLQYEGLIQTDFTHCKIQLVWPCHVKCIDDTFLSGKTCKPL